jgi:hypothetical protein
MYHVDVNTELIPFILSFPPLRTQFILLSRTQTFLKCMRVPSFPLLFPREVHRAIYWAVCQALVPALVERRRFLGQSVFATSVVARIRKFAGTAYVLESEAESETGKISDPKL